MKKFLETCQKIEDQYKDAAKLGFISALGVLLCLLSLLILRQHEIRQKRLIDYKTTKEIEVLQEAERVCPKNLDYINITDINGKWQIECGGK